MFDATSFTSEPQYQRPDNRASDLDFVRKEPIIITPPAPAVSTTTVDYDYDFLFVRRLFDKLAREMLVCNRLDFFGNSIILGSFCYAIKFIIYGFYRCKVYKVNDSFLWAVVLLFGGVGQVTAGFLEYLKGRVYPTVLYLTIGFYCLCHYGLIVLPEWFGITNNMQMLYNYTEDSLCCFYSAWVVIIFGLMCTANRINVILMLQIMSLLMGFLMRCLGEGMGSEATKRQASGILLVISGFCSLYFCISQIFNNETFFYQMIPTCPLNPFNEVDLMNNAPAVLPLVTATPVVPVATPVATPVVPVAATPVAATPVVPVAATPVAATPVAATPVAVV